MKVKLVLAGLAAIGMLAACGDDDNNDSGNNSGQTSNRPWQNLVVKAECDDAADPADLCNNGNAVMTFNWDGTFNFNGNRTGTMSEADLERLADAADPVAEQDTVQQQSCDESSSDVLLANSISMLVTGASQSVVVYEERDNADEVCTRGDRDRLLDLRELLAELSVKYATSTTTPTPTPTPSPSPTPEPTATPAPTATP